MRIENSPAYLAEINRTVRKMDRERAKAKADYAAAKRAWRRAGATWRPMKTCPFAALDKEHDLDGAILVSDGAKVALVTIRERFGRPLIWVGKGEPEEVYRDGALTFEGDGEWKEPDRPAWWFKWELTDEFGMMTYAGGEETGKEEIDFVPTMWTFLAEPPKAKRRG